MRTMKPLLHLTPSAVTKALLQGLIATMRPVWSAVLISTACLNLRASEALRITHKGRWPELGSGPTAVAVSGGHAFLAVGGVGLAVLDISGLGEPRLLARRDTGGWSRAVAVAGNHAYVADAVGGLQVFDITNKADPQRVGVVTNTEPIDVTVAGTHAYVREMSSGVSVIDVSAPAQPRLVGKYATVGQASGFALSGGLAYIGFDDLDVLDVSRPENPRLLGRFPGLYGKLAAASQFVYVAGGRRVGMNWVHGFFVIDVSAPASPKLVGEILTADVDYYPEGVAVSGGHVYIVGSSSQVVDVRDPSNPRSLGVFPGGGSFPGYPGGVSVMGDRAYVGAGGGFAVVDISGPERSQVVSRYLASSFVYACRMAGGFAYVLTSDGGNLVVVDVSNPTRPRQVGRLENLGGSHLAVSGRHAYVAINDGLLVIDVADPTKPLRVGKAEGRWPDARAVGLSGNFAWVADGTEGIQVIDVSDPTNPYWLSGYHGCPGNGLAGAMAVAGRYVYTTACDRFMVLEISPARELREVGSYRLEGFRPGSLTLAGDYALVGQEIIDISNPNSPHLARNWDRGFSHIGRVAAWGSYALGAAGEMGLLVLDLNDSLHPQAVETTWVGGTPGFKTYDVAVEGNTLCIASYVGIDVWEMTELPAINRQWVTADGRLGIRWNEAAKGMRLQRTGSLSSPDWQSLPGAENTNAVTLPMDGGCGFFRLVKP